MRLQITCQAGGRMPETPRTRFTSANQPFRTSFSSGRKPPHHQASMRCFLLLVLCGLLAALREWGPCQHTCGPHPLSHWGLPSLPWLWCNLVACSANLVACRAARATPLVCQLAALPTQYLLCSTPPAASSQAADCTALGVPLLSTCRAEL